MTSKRKPADDGVKDRQRSSSGQSSKPDDAGDGEAAKDDGKSDESSKFLDKKIHKPRDSLFSFSSGYNNYRGFLNFCIILLILSNARLLLENVLKYGILVDPVQWVTVVMRDPHRWPLFTVCLQSNVFVYIALKIEQLLNRKVLSEKTGVALQIVNLITVLVFAAVSVWWLPSFLVAAFSTMIVYSILFLKLTSYVMVNRWYRLEAKGEIPHNQFQHPEMDEKSQTTPSETVTYPDNLTLKNVAYFWVAPTLCYELNYPRNPGIRKLFLAKRLVEILLLTQIELAIAQQWVLPIMQNSVAPLQESDWSKVTERLLKLAIPNHFLWLLGFYLIFHSMLNAVAELLRFADRQFYLDWWNAESIQTFWRNWNVPVHLWAVRHVYQPLVSNGFSKMHAACVVFLVSAFFHEFIVSVPLQLFRAWAFMGMLLQLPIAMFTNKYLKGRAGNMAMWISLIVGQPLAILMYFHDYYIQARKNDVKSFI